MIKLQLKRLCIAALVTSTCLSFLSCGGNKSSDPSGPSTGPRDGNDNVGGQDVPSGPKVCKGARILEILDNGSNVVSRLGSDQSKIVNWDIDSGIEVSFLDMPINPYRVSSNGKYLIREISYKKFQIIHFSERKTYTSKVITLNAAYEPMPVINFSSDSRYLVMSYRPFGQGYSHSIDIYNLEEDRFVSTLRARNVLFTGTTRNSKSYFVAFQEGNQAMLHKIDAETASIEFELKLEKYENYSHMYLGEEVILFQGSHGYSAYDIETGKLLYKKNLKHVYDIGSEGLNALVSDDWENLKVMDLQTGQIILNQKKPMGLTLSDCQLVDRPMKLICIDSVNQSKVIVLNLEDGSTKKSCY